MKFRHLLNEKWIKSVPSRYKGKPPIDIYLDPTSKEVQEVFRNFGNTARGILTKDNKFYFFAPTELHQYVADKLDLLYKDTFSLIINNFELIDVYYINGSDFMGTKKEEERIIDRVRKVIPSVYKRKAYIRVE